MTSTCPPHAPNKCACEMGKKKRVLNVRKKTLQLSEAKKSEGTAITKPHSFHCGTQISSCERDTVGHTSGQTLYGTPVPVRVGLSARLFTSVLVRHVCVGTP